MDDEYTTSSSLSTKSPCEIIIDSAFKSDAALSGKRKIQTCLIRVFIGGKTSTQVQPFLCGLQRSRSWWDFQYIDFPVVQFMSTDDLKLLRWDRDITFLIDWLLESDIHYILNHVHQGFPRMTCRNIQTQLSRLVNHRGFPSKLSNFSPR